MILWILLGIITIGLLCYLWLRFKPIHFAPFVISVIALGMNAWTLVHQKSVEVDIALINAELETLKTKSAKIGKLEAGPTLIKGGLTITN